MATAANAKLDIEQGRTSYSMQALTDSGDHKTFTSPVSVWSMREGFTPVIRPNGLLSGGVVSVGSGNDNVSVAAMSLNLNGVVTSVSADATNAITRAVSTDTHIINSITVSAAGAIVVIAGTDSTAFSETRGAAGGPPFIPVDSVEIAQVRLTSNVAAPVTAAEIFSTPGIHTEDVTTPAFSVNDSAGQVEFVGALPLIHTGGVPKRVYASFAEPIYAELGNVADVVVPETSNSVSSTAVYGGVINSRSSSLGQASWNYMPDDPMNNPVSREKGFSVKCRFYPDRYKTGYIEFGGVLAVTRSWPASGIITFACTVSAEREGTEVSS